MSTTSNVDAILTDSDFRQLPLAEKNKVLLARAPDYKALPPQEQMKVLQTIHYGSEPDGGKGFGKASLGVLGRQAKAAIVEPFSHGVVGGLKEAGKRLLEQSVDPTGAIRGTADAVEGYASRRKAGYNPVYSALAPVAASQTGVNLPGAEAAAAKGHMAETAAEFAVPATEAAATEAAHQVSKIPAVNKRIPGTPAYNERVGTRQVGEAIAVPTGEEAKALGGRRGAPDALAAGKDLALVRDHLAQIERESPVKGKGSRATFARAKNVLDYADRYWETEHKAAIDRLGKAPFDARPLVAAGESAITPEAAEGSPRAAGEATRAREWLQEKMGRQRNLQSADQLLREINADLRSPSAQTSYGPVGLRVQSAVAKALRAEIDATLTRYGEPGIKFKNMTWGALTNVADRMTTQAISEMKAEGKAGVLPPWAKAYVLVHPSPEGLAMAYAFGGKLEKMFKPTPSGKLASGMGKLAKSELTPPPSTPSYSRAPTSPQRMLPQKSSAFGDPMVTSREMRLGQATRPEKMIQEAGGEFVSFDQDRAGGPRYVTFKDPKTGRMFVLREDKVSPAAVAARMKATAPARMTPPPQ